MTKLISVLLLAMLAGQATAQEAGYITDTLFVPVRSGQGSEYRIVHRGIPSGTQLVVNEVNEETGFSRITTAGGTEGWILSRYIMQEVPAAAQLKTLRAQNQVLMGDENSLRSQMVTLHASEADMRAELEAAGLTKTDEAPDVYVLYHVALNQDRRIQVDDFGYWNRWRGPRYGGGDVTVFDVNVGTLIVDMLDADSEEAVWRGMAQKDLPPTPDPDKMEKKLAKILRKMFHNYPPE